ncbi:WAT1-related protein [Citrus sinensis]|nr:WAT1-related protein [Citrus sinensis]
MAGPGRYCCKDVLPFTATVAMECINVGLNTLFKAATSKGMSHFVFVVYSYGVAALVLLPAPFFSYRSRVLPPFTFSILCKIGLLGLIGSSSQIMGYTGINYSSPTLASAISNLTPAFTFVLTIIFRMEKVACRKASSQAKVLGTIVSIAGAFIVTLYRGPRITTIASPKVSLNHALRSSNSNWAVGGLFLTAEYILVPLWYIVQLPLWLITERDSSAWKVGPGIALASIVCSGLFGSCMKNSVHTWALRLKGPVFVAMFKPLSIAIAVAMGVMFLGDRLYLGSLVGATIISLGFYTVMWGKAKEEVSEDPGVDRQESAAAQKVPLLQSRKNELV